MGTAIGDRVLIRMKEGLGLRILLLGMTLVLAACSRGSEDDQNLGAASGNSLTSAQIDAALGPANQQQFLTNDVNGETAQDSANSGARKHEAVRQESPPSQLNAETNSAAR